MFNRVLLISAIFGLASSGKPSCPLPRELEKEIHGYKSVVRKIIEASTSPENSGRLFNDVQDFVDTFGSRVSGSPVLEKSIDNVVRRIRKTGLKVKTEQVSVPNWVRGNEYATMIAPRKKKLNILGLGFSGSTPKKGITARVVVVKDFKELQDKSSEIRGAIVLFNAGFTEYHETVTYRSNGPRLAAEMGAAAVLVKSITPFSVDSPHTGVTEFLETRPIPAAAITLEDADLIARLVAQKKKVKISIYMQNKRKANRVSRNVIVDIPGNVQPNSYVTFSGHIDSWDVGQGAMDDAGGAFLSWHSLALLQGLGLKTKRTIRAILWTAEEEGLYGAEAYLQEHKEELKNWSAAFESDLGVFEPKGYLFAGNEDAQCIMQHVVALFKPIKATEIQAVDSAGSDIETFLPEGVPLGEPLMVENKYFWYHHTNADTMNVLNSVDMDRNLAMFAATAYVLGNLSIQLPRGPQTAEQLLRQAD